MALPVVLTRLLLVAITLTATRWGPSVLPDPARFLSHTPRVGGTLLSRWYHWDAAWYLRIAGNGPQMGYSHYWENPDHHYSAFAFFPLYPLSVRAVGALVPGALAAVPLGGVTHPRLLLAGLIAANVAFVLAMVALYLLADARAGPVAARRAVWLLCLFPTTVFFSAPYSESLFLLWLILFFLALDRRRWALAGLCGALAGATRSLGVALVVPYAIAYWQQRRLLTDAPQRHGGTDKYRCDLRASVPLWCKQLAPVLLIPLGLVGYMAYLKVAWGDPFLFREAEQAWGRSLAAPWVGIWDGLTWSLRPWPHLPQPNWRGLTDALYAVVFLVLTVLAWRKTDWPDRAYVVIFWLYVLCEPQINDPAYPDTLISMPRFLLVLLPVWLWLARGRWRTLIVAVPSAALLCIYAARWVNGGWIG